MSGSDQTDEKKPEGQLPNIQPKNSDLAIIEQKRAAVEKALSLLPEDLQKPISEYVSQHIDLKLAPAPVTRAEYWVHWAFVAGFFALWSVYFLIRRRLTPIDEDLSATMSAAMLVTFWVWAAASICSAFLRIQTQSFRLTATFIAAGFGTLGFFLVNDISPVFYFYLKPRWVGTSVVTTLHCIVGFYWAFWFAKRALPTTSISVLRRVVGTVLGVVVFNLMLILEGTPNGPRELPKVQIIPFAAHSGSEIDLHSVLDQHFKEASASTHVRRKK